MEEKRGVLEKKVGGSSSFNRRLIPTDGTQPGKTPPKVETIVAKAEYTLPKTAVHKNLLMGEVKTSLRDALNEAAMSLLKPINTIREEIENDEGNRIEAVVNMAIKKCDTKFIQWIFEMVIGKPHQTIENKSEYVPHATINRIDGSSVTFSLIEKPTGEKSEDK